MAEKNDLPTDTVSLPPTYAPSEAFTESPPPAYRRPGGMAAVKVARIVCITLLMMTFIIGFFVVTHKWVQSKECSHPLSNAEASNLAAMMMIPETQKLVKEEETPEEEEIDTNQLIDEAIEQEKELEEEDEEELLEDLNNSIKLPKDILLGNPALAGNNVKCRVQKKQQKLAEGILTQAIIVTCDDEDNDDSDMAPPPPGIRRLNGPPMSLLGNLMKILASRPRSEEVNEDLPPMMPFPMSRPNQGPFPMSRPNQGPFPMSRPNQSPFPMSRPNQSPFPMSRSNQGPFPGPFGPGAIHMVPIKRIELRRPDLVSDGSEHGPRPFIMTPRGPMPLIRPTIKQIIGSSNPMNRPLPPHLIFNKRMEDIERNPMRQLPPLPFGSGPLPIRVIRLPQNNEDEEENRPPMPLSPFHPIMNLVPGRRARIIHLKPREEEQQNERDLPPFLRPSGEIPHMHLPPPQQMPAEARARALHAPMALPEVRVMRFPFRPQSRPFAPLHEARVSTGIEVQPPREEERPLIPFLPEQPIIKEDKEDFGPPKTHSVIETGPQTLAEEEELAPPAALSFSPQDRVTFEPSDVSLPSQDQPEEELNAQPSNVMHRMIIN